MSRVAHVNLGVAGSAADGIGSVVAALHREQTLRGDEVLVLGPGAVPPGNPWWTAAAAAARLAEFGPDTVHFHSLFRPAHALLAAWCRRAGVPHVVSPHSALAVEGLRRDALRKRLWVRAVDAPMLHRASGVLCLTDQEKVEVLAVVPGARTHVVPNLLPPAAVPGTAWTGSGAGGGGGAGAGGGRKRIVTLARYDVHQKGLDRIADVARLLPGVDFLVHGTFDRNDPDGARRLIAQAPPNLEFAGVVVGADKDRALAGADLYLQPSRWEGMSVAVLEAMRAGVPCAVSEEVALTLGEGAATVFVLGGNPLQAAGELARILADSAEGPAAARAARVWAERTTTPDRVIEALRAAYALSGGCVGGASELYGPGARPATIEGEQK